MKAFFLFTLFISVSFKIEAQLVTNVGCCLDLANKATIIINDNSASSNSSSATATVSYGFNFKLTSSVNTSAGVYNPQSTLVRTLWGGVRYEAGCYTGVWDGLLDDGTQAPFGTYTVKVLTNNVTYTAEGIIGNTTNPANPLINYGGISALASAGNKVFLGNGFYEGGVISKYFNTSDVQNVNSTSGAEAIILDAATDGTNVYWACADQYQSSHYVFATKVSDNSPYLFSTGISHATGRGGISYPSLIAFRQQNNNYQYRAIAVQKGSGTFGFVDRPDSNYVYVFNKNTGAPVNKLSVNNPDHMVAGSSGELWLITNGVLTKYSINASTGAITPAGLTITSINPATLAISPDNTTLLVTDNATQQIKAYSNSNGSLLWVLGDLNGNNANPAVTYTRFSFSHVYANPVISYQDDGSFWLNDAGNMRLLHFTANRAYKEQVAYIPSFRSVNVDVNDPTRVFADELEFKRDYSKTLDNGTNGSWKLVNNWKYGTNLDAFRKFTQVITLTKNGIAHTYATGENTFYELIQNMGASLIGGLTLDWNNFKMDADGTLFFRTIINNTAVIKTIAFTGFSGNVPQWGFNNQPILCTSPVFTSLNAYAPNNNTRWAGTNANKYFFFNPNTYAVGYHLAAINTSNNTVAWQASKSTYFDYHGDYPRNGDFDIGNNDYNVQHSENCQALVNGTNVFWNVNAEFWKANAASGGANIWNHFNEDGLLIGNFGKTAYDAALYGNVGFVGNGFSTALAKVNGDFYIYQADESQHGGITCWHVSGLNTILEQTIPVTLSAVVTVSADPADLMAGLPFKSNTFTSGNGWTVGTPVGLNMSTNVNQYQRENTDLYIQGNGTQTVKRTLNNSAPLNSWVLTGGINFGLGEPTISGDNYNYFEIIDASGKVIVNVHKYCNTGNGYYTSLLFNGKHIVDGANGSIPELRTSENFSINYTNGSITFNYAGFTPVTVTTTLDSDAIMSAPAFIRIRQSSPGNQNHIMNMYKLRFSSK